MTTKQKEETSTAVKGEESVEEQVQEDCNDAEKALTTKDACDYSAKERIKRAAKRLEDKFIREGKEDKIGTISTIIRKYFDNPRHKDYVSTILSEIDGGKYIRNWISKDYQKILYNKLRESGDGFNDRATAISEGRFPPKDISAEKLARYILGMEAVAKIIEPIRNRRWAVDWLEWCDIIENYYEYGGSYASSKSAVEVADLVDSKTGKPKERKITKEQIDASLVNKVNDMAFIVENLKYFLEFCKDFSEFYKSITRE